MIDSEHPDLFRLRADMLRFATLQLHDEAAAEDVVQEAMLAAMTTAPRFEGRAQLKTWVFAILKNKIVDAIRKQSRSPVVAFETDEIPEEAFDGLFDSQGYWRPAEHPADWGDPEQAFTSSQFWQVFETCLTQLTENTARVFMMKEFLGFSTDEICKELGITTTNCWVVLHRARMNLRLCLQQRWFDSK